MIFNNSIPFPLLSCSKITLYFVLVATARRKTATQIRTVSRSTRRKPLHDCNTPNPDEDFRHNAVSSARRSNQKINSVPTPIYEESEEVGITPDVRKSTKQTVGGKQSMVIS